MIQSHGGSGKQALEVANGLEADVVTLALEGDVQVVADAGMIEDGFEDEFDQESSPYTSTIVFLVRKDNPKNIADWDDLLREDVGVITELPADGKWIVDDIALTDIAHFGGWSEASAKHFADGGVFEAIHEQ